MFIDVTQLTSLLVYQLEIFVPVRVNGTNTLAQLDTGANLVSISPRLAEGLPHAGKVGVGSAFDLRTFDKVGNVEVEFLGRVYQTEARLLERQDTYPFDAGAVLNASIIYGQPLLLDFRLLCVAQPNPISSPSWSELTATYLETTNLCIVELEAVGKSLFALFDTGAGISVLNSAHLTDFPLKLQKGYEIEIGDATGAKKRQSVMRCSGLGINGWALPSFDCFATDLKPIEEAIGHRIDAILGANLLLKSGLRWSFDKPAGKVFIAE